MPDDRTSETIVDVIASPRRSFVARLAGLVAAWPVVGRVRVGRAVAAIGSPRSLTEPNAALLALGDAILPAELGTAGVTRAVAEFQQWIDGYQPGAEANHGYGTGKIERLTADPRPQWRTQLTAFDADARRNGAQSFAALPRDGRQALVRTALAAERGDSLPAPLAASHIALALLGHFYDSPAATDLCYEVQIGRQLCRPLPAQRQQPVALTRRDR